MTNSSGRDRLEQIAELLQQSIIVSNERMTRIEQQREQDLVASRERMTRIEQQREQDLVASRERIREIEQLTQSNSRAIQALADRIAEVTFDIQALQETNRQAEAEREQLRQATLGIANLLASLDEDRPTVLRKLNSIENKVDRLLQQE